VQHSGSAGHADHCDRRTDESMGLEVQQRRGRALVRDNALPVPVLRRAKRRVFVRKVAWV
jgi:hypothetical protein